MRNFIGTFARFMAFVPAYLYASMRNGWTQGVMTAIKDIEPVPQIQTEAPKEK